MRRSSVYAPNESRYVQRERIVALLRREPDLTLDEIAQRLDRNVLVMRPRVAELYRRRLVVTTGARVSTVSGLTHSVWRVR